MSKTTFGTVKMVLPAKKATMGAPVGPALGQVGVQAKQFCDLFNDRTKNLPDGTMVPVKVYYKNSGKVFEIEIKSESTVSQLKKLLNAEKLQGLTITREQIETVAKAKIVDNTASCLEQMCNTVIGTARSCGLKIIG